jgi:hypothetical protein
MVDSYVAATLVRRAPSDLKDSLLDTWAETNIQSANKSFLQSAEKILGRSRGRAGMHEVQLKALARYNSRRIDEPGDAVQQWFDNVERGLMIYTLTKGSIRKNGHRVVSGMHVSYKLNEGSALRIGTLASIYVGARPSAPFAPCYAVCVVRRYLSSRLRQSDHFRQSGMLILSMAGDQRGVMDYVCSTLLLHLYLRVIWSEEGSLALVRMEEL